jgi:signal transduction histidine kinase
LASLAALVEHSSSCGLAVTAHTFGEPRRLAHATDQAAYRILQEALTNAGRHGAGSAEIEVSYTTDALELTVTNPVSPRDAGRNGGGHGLVGMRERAELLGGSLDTRRIDGGFRLHARLPYGGRPR